MPIVEPPTLNALGLIPFQINPHYTDARIEGHMGETRDERLTEFTHVNPGVRVIGLREGTMLRIRKLTYQAETSLATARILPGSRRWSWPDP